MVLAGYRYLSGNIPIVFACAGVRLQNKISAKRNTIANYAGTFLQVLLGFVFIPFYIKYLGIESYGLIGFYVSLAALFRLADLGLSATLNREFARYTALPDSARQMRNLLKTLQTVYWGLSLLSGLIIVLCAPLIAEYWINPGSLDISVVKKSVKLMGLTIALQGPMGLYTGGIFGLQRHVLANLINVVYAALRYGGVVLVLALFSPTLTLFFSFQLGAALVGALCSGMVLWRLLPEAGITSRFDRLQLKSVWRFAAGMSINSVLWLILSQMDKILLIKLLPLNIFGYYALASTAASAVTYLGAPLFTTFLPRYTQLYAAGDFENLRRTYRTSCRINAIIMIPTVVLLAFFSREALLIWTGNPDIAGHAWIILSFLAIGHGLNQLALMSFALQVASGDVKLAVYTDAAAVVIAVPSLLCATHFYGASGAAAVWIALGFFYVFFYVNVLHLRILRGEALHWYIGVLPPSAVALGCGLAWHYFAPSLNGAWLVASICFVWIIAVATTSLASSDIRIKIAELIR